MNPKHEDSCESFLFHGEVYLNINFNFTTILRKKIIFGFQILGSIKEIIHKAVPEPYNSPIFEH